MFDNENNEDLFTHNLENLMSVVQQKKNLTEGEVKHVTQLFLDTFKEEPNSISYFFPKIKNSRYKRRFLCQLPTGRHTYR